MNVRDWSPALKGAAAALVLCLGIAIWTIVRAMSTDSIPEAAPTLINTAGALAPPVFVAASDIHAAVETDPFVAERTAPPVPYRMPGEDEPKVGTVQKPVVLGTAVGLDGTDFITCQLGDGNPHIMHVGDRIGEYTIKTIERARVVFTTVHGEKLEVAPLKTGS